jgi:hypothetical protein
MRKPVEDALVLAFERAVGRAPAPSESDSGALDAFAGRVVAAGRRAFAAPACPSAWLRRAAALSEVSASPGPVRAALWRLVFDSWAQAAPALRGPGRSRFLRFASTGGSLDVEMVTSAAGEVRLRGTLDGLGNRLALEVAPRPGSSHRTQRVPVRAGGAFAAAIPSGASPFTLSVRSGRRTLVRTSRIPPTRAG